MQDQSTGTGSKAGALAFVLYAVVLTVLPVIGLPLWYGSESAFWLLTGDAYLYLGIAEESREVFTFDGQRPTNGFHPAWQFYIWTLRHGLGLNDLVLMNTVAWSNVALVLAGVLMLGRAIARVTGRWALGVLVVPGVYYMTVGQGIDNLAVWNAFGGMEDALAFALGGALALAVAGMTAPPTPARLAVIGLVLAALFFTRLDEAFTVLGIAGVLFFWPGQGVLQRVLRPALVSVPAGLVLLAYLAWNLSYMGMAMPISGAAKGDLALVQNGWVTAVNLFGPLFDLREGITAWEGVRVTLSAALFRVLELIYPAILALLLALAVLRWHRAAPWAAIALGVAVGIVLKAGYNFVNVNYWHQSAWYFGFANAQISFLTAIVLGPPLLRMARDARLLGALSLTAFVALALFHASRDYAERAITAPPERTFWQARAEIGSALRRARPDAQVLEFGDGIVNFSLDQPVRHAFVFAGDRYSLDALREGRLLAASYEDGYRVLSGFGYLTLPERSGLWTSDALRDWLSATLPHADVRQELDGFDFELIHLFEPTRTPFIAFTPKGG